MKTRLTIEEIRKGSDSRPLGHPEEGEVVIGRDKTCPLSLDNTAISRQHGVFQQVNSHWLYKDLGSTNGSWLNGLPLAEGQWRLVRAGDLMQIADIAMRIVGPEGEGASAGRSLLVFANGIFLREIDVPSAGAALSIGTQEADLSIEQVSDQKSVVVIERLGADVLISQSGLDGEVFLNDEPMEREGTLNDRDVLRLQQYTVILNDPNRTPEPMERGARDADDPWAD